MTPAEFAASLAADFWPLAGTTYDDGWAFR